MIRPLLLALALVAGGILLWGLLQKPLAAPALEFGTIDGRRFDLADLAGRPVLINFWSTSCTICIAEMPYQQKLYEQYQARGFELIGVSMPYDRPDVVLELVREKGITYPVALDLDGSAMKAFSVKATPSSFLVDPEGVIQMSTTGRLDRKQLQQRITTMLGGQS